MKDGKAAGMSVDHVHIHILPRIPGDFSDPDQVHRELENWSHKPSVKAVVDDNLRM